MQAKDFSFFADIYYASGNVVAAYSQQPNGSWGFTEYPTNAELSRSHEFMQMWYDARILPYFDGGMLARARCVA